MYGKVLRGPDHLKEPRPAPLVAQDPHALPRAHLEIDALDAPALLLDRLRVLGGELLPPHERGEVAIPLHRIVPGDMEKRPVRRHDVLLDALAEAREHRHHAEHRHDADRHAENQKPRPHPVREDDVDRLLEVLLP